MVTFKLYKKLHSVSYPPTLQGGHWFLLARESAFTVFIYSNPCNKILVVYTRSFCREMVIKVRNGSRK